MKQARKQRALVHRHWAIAQYWPHRHREKYQAKDYKEKKKLHEERLRNTKDEPSHYLPKQYYTGEIGKKGTKGLVTHIDVVRFKALWEEHLSSNPEVIQSKEQGVHFEFKPELRYSMAQFSIANKAALSIRVKDDDDPV